MSLHALKVTSTYDASAVFKIALPLFYLFYLFKERNRAKYFFDNRAKSATMFLVLFTSTQRVLMTQRSKYANHFSCR